MIAANLYSKVKRRKKIFIGQLIVVLVLAILFGFTFEVAASKVHNPIVLVRRQSASTSPPRPTPTPTAPPPNGPANRAPTSTFANSIPPNILSDAVVIKSAPTGTSTDGATKSTPTSTSTDSVAKSTPTTKPNDDASECFSLAESKLCPQFGSALLPVTYKIGNMTVKNSKDFDKALASVLNAEDEPMHANLWAMNCTNWRLDLLPRFSTTIACGEIANSNEAINCSKKSVNSTKDTDQKSTTNDGRRGPLSVCRNTCDGYVNDWISIIKDKSVCPSSGKWFKTRQEELLQFCDKDFVRGQPGVCIRGDLNEPNTCGFMLPANKDTACEYCYKHNDDPCCTKIDDTIKSCTLVKIQGTSDERQKTNYILIICACAAAVVIIAAFVLWRFRQNKNQTLNRNKQPNQIYRAIFAYLPNLEDEMLIEVGDVIEVDQIFSDDWAHGCNYTTGEIGMLPLSFVSLAGSAQKYEKSPWLSEKQPVPATPQSRNSKYSSKALSEHSPTDVPVDRHTWHTSGIVAASAASRNSNFGAPRAYSYQGAQRPLTQRTASLRISNLGVPPYQHSGNLGNYTTFMTNTSTRSYFDYRQGQDRRSHLSPNDPLHHFDSSISAVSDTETHAESVIIVPVTRNSSINTYDPQRSPPSPPQYGR
ncbi:hypothetical protein BDF19DRAFT_456211 [Syncephalis fuscata]|nr:hypothetical protein BDF19DRAFT_456211 [Syncephalis fuscata]